MPRIIVCLTMLRCNISKGIKTERKKCIDPETDTMGKKAVCVVILLYEHTEDVF